MKTLKNMIIEWRVITNTLPISCDDCPFFERTPPNWYNQIGDQLTCNLLDTELKTLVPTCTMYDWSKKLLEVL